MRKFSNLSVLPPIEAAAKQHCFRVYFQLQQWNMNFSLNVTIYGWKKTKNGLMPIMTTADVLPKKFMENIFCSCTKRCQTLSCSCKKMRHLLLQTLQTL